MVADVASGVFIDFTSDNRVVACDRQFIFVVVLRVVILLWLFLLLFLLLLLGVCSLISR